jgi:hypothetical protein
VSGVPATAPWQRARWLLANVNADTVRAAAWAALTLRRLRRDLKANGLEAAVPRPPRLADRGIRGVTGFSALARATCLERSFLLQGWLAERGRPYPIAVGVIAPAAGEFKAHAWVQGFDPDPGLYRILAQVPPPPSGAEP